MNIDRIVLLIAGTVILIGLALGVWVNPYWLLLAALVGLNLMQASFTGFCPAAVVLKKLRVPTGAVF
jgi:hypothetical protein